MAIYLRPILLSLDHFINYSLYTLVQLDTVLNIILYNSYLSFISQSGIRKLKEFYKLQGGKSNNLIYNLIQDILFNVILTDNIKFNIQL